MSEHDRPAPSHLTPALPVAARLADRARSRSRELRVRGRLAAAGLERVTRAVLTGAGLPIKKEFLVLGCGTGADASGLFSEVAAVIGALEHYEAWRSIYAGLQVDFKNHGLYHDSTAGDNWWEYYFESINLGSAAGAVTRAVAALQHDAFAYRVEQSMPRTTAAAVVGRHVRIKPFVIERVERFWREALASDRVIGVHYRGTDKAEDAAAIPYDTMSTAIRAALQAEGPGRCQIFVATDDQAFLDHARAVFPDQVHALPMRRSEDGRPLHKTHGEGFSQGADAVIDCLLLARCHRLIRTTSNLSLCSTLFNPALPVTLLGRG